MSGTGTKSDSYSAGRRIKGCCDAVPSSAYRRRPNRATEVLTGTDAVLSQIREGKTHQLGSVMQSGAAAGMHTLDYDLAKLVSRGLIEKKTALKYAQDKRELEQCIF